MASVEVQLDPGLLAHILDVWPVARLATVDAGGQPHLVPIVFVAIDGVIYSPIDGKPKRSGNLQRLRNVAHNGAVCLLLDCYDDDWRALWWLRIDAAADVLLGADSPAPMAERIAAALRAKYPQYDSVDLFVDRPTLLRFRPERNTAWSAQPIDWDTLVAPRKS
jgi:PPOX class probable F420-dependent enzyme